MSGQRTALFKSVGKCFSEFVKKIERPMLLEHSEKSSFSGRFWGFFRSVSAFESRGYVILFTCTHTLMFGAWGRKKRPSFRLDAISLLYDYNYLPLSQKGLYCKFKVAYLKFVSPPMTRLPRQPPYLDKVLCYRR